MPKLVAAGIVVVVDIVRRPDDEAPQGASIVKKADEIDAATIVLCPHEQDFKEVIAPAAFLPQPCWRSTPPYLTCTGLLRQKSGMTGHRRSLLHSEAQVQSSVATSICISPWGHRCAVHCTQTCRRQHQHSYTDIVQLASSQGQMPSSAIESTGHEV